MEKKRKRKKKEIKLTYIKAYVNVVYSKTLVEKILILTSIINYYSYLFLVN